MSSDITLAFLGHSAWRILHGDYDILIDPFITGNPVATVTADQLDPTHIILTHGHGDHLGDAIGIGSRGKAQVISTFEVANYVRGRGCADAVGMGIGGAHNFNFGRVKFTIAHHSSSAPDGTYLGNPAGVVITIGGRSIYHAGDTALFLDMQLIGSRDHLDVALLPIGDYFTMGVKDAVTAAEFLMPDLVIPMHYDTFPPIKVDAEDFRSRLEEKGIRCAVLRPGESHTIPAGA
ncbi:MAG: metal-dependent hydrolase [Chlorobi bacterium]|nr:metal-dependent hydrolase [Chlorobiota bacterium]